MKDNPFIPSFGEIPKQLIGREKQISLIKNALKSKRDPYRTVIFSGARGYGKTVMLEAISDIGLKYGFITINTTVNDDMLDGILCQAYKKTKHLINIKNKIVSGFSLGKIGVNFTEKQFPETFRDKLEIIMDKLSEKSVGLIITVDEIYPTSKELKTLSIVLQHFKREKRNIAVYFAGLPKHVENTLKEKENTQNITFLRRAEKEILKQVSISETKNFFFDMASLDKKQIKINVLNTMANATYGYPFLIQLIGYYTWNYNNKKRIITLLDVKNAIKTSINKLNSLVYESSFLDLSKTEQKILLTMNKFNKEEVFTNELLKKIKMTNANFQQHRNSLIKQELIYSTSYGKLKFTLPYLKNYILNNF